MHSHYPIYSMYVIRTFHSTGIKILTQTWLILGYTMYQVRKLPPHSIIAYICIEGYIREVRLFPSGSINFWEYFFANP